jgi:hypothetical protein
MFNDLLGRFLFGSVSLGGFKGALSRDSTCSGYHKIDVPILYVDKIEKSQTKASKYARLVAGCNLMHP